MITMIQVFFIGFVIMRSNPGAPGLGETFLYNSLLKIYKTDINELKERAKLARSYFENVIQKYFQDPTLYFLQWLNK